MMDNEVEPEAGWYSNDAATFGDRVSAAREAVGLTQTDLARKLGVKLKTVAAWEEDLSEPRANKLQLLSGVLNVSMMWLLSGEGEGLGAPEEDAPLDADVSAILSEVRHIRTSLLHMTERLAIAEKRLRKAIREGA